MTKVLLEIVKLLWKLVKLAFWKWLRPMLGTIAFVAAVIVVLCVIVAVLAMQGC